MNLNIYNEKAEVIGKKQMPLQFMEDIRPDLVKRAVVAILANDRQAFGVFTEAGKRSPANKQVSKRRRNYKCSYGHGISRVPRQVMSRRGRYINWRGAFCPGAVGGRKSHPPKAEKIWDQKINKKERKKAIKSALAATLNLDLVKQRSHIVPSAYPFVFSKDIEQMSKLREIIDLFSKLGFTEEFERVSKKTVRAGKGKRRGRYYKKIRGILIVTSSSCAFTKAAKNIPGVEVKSVKTLNAEDLAPGTHIGRLTIFTESALDKMSELNLFC